MKSPKQLPCKYFYDERGSQLFDEITRLPEYYLTRAEQSILETHAAEIASLFGENCLLIEYGSGSSRKTRTLLDKLPDLAGYVPVDISREHLSQAAAGIAAQYPHIEVLPLFADYERPFEIPVPVIPVARRVVFFPGSTIGNFNPAEAVAFLRRIRVVCGPDSTLLIGVDLKKERSILDAAYNDSAGVTAEFNLNILRRLNHELGSNFNLANFRHEAFYNEAYGRVEMHLVSICEQQVYINGQIIRFGEGERIWTESSHKYSLRDFEQLASKVGYQVTRVWTDSNNLFSVQYLTPARDAGVYPNYNVASQTRQL